MIVLDLRTGGGNHGSALEHVIVDGVAGPVGLGEMAAIAPVAMVRAVRMLGLSGMLGMGFVVVSMFVRHTEPPLSKGVELPGKAQGTGGARPALVAAPGVLVLFGAPDLGVSRSPSKVLRLPIVTCSGSGLPRRRAWS